MPSYKTKVQELDAHQFTGDEFPPEQATPSEGETEKEKAKREKLAAEGPKVPKWFAAAVQAADIEIVKKGKSALVITGGKESGAVRRAFAGDYITKNKAGNYGVYTPDKFAELFEEVAA